MPSEKRTSGEREISPLFARDKLFGKHNLRPVHLECHATLGWVLGNAFANDRKVRAYAVIGAILPDIDAIPYIFGPYYYGLLHHTFGHNIFLALLFAAYGWWRFKSWKIATLGAAVFASHLLTDAWLSNWSLYLFWPLSQRGYLPENSLELGSPVNTWLVYSTPLFLALVALIWKRTPLEWISPQLDRLFISFFQKKSSHCSLCAQPSNLHCQICLQPLCAKHSVIRKGWSLLCPVCSTPPNNPPAPASLATRPTDDPEAPARPISPAG